MTRVNVGTWRGRISVTLCHICCAMLGRWSYKCPIYVMRRGTFNERKRENHAWHTYFAITFPPHVKWMDLHHVMGCDNFMVHQLVVKERSVVDGYVGWWTHYYYCWQGWSGWKEEKMGESRPTTTTTTDWLFGYEIKPKSGHYWVLDDVPVKVDCGGWSNNLLVRLTQLYIIQLIFYPWSDGLPSITGEVSQWWARNYWPNHLIIN